MLMFRGRNEPLPTVKDITRFRLIWIAVGIIMLLNSFATAYVYPGKYTVLVVGCLVVVAMSINNVVLANLMIRKHRNSQ